MNNKTDINFELYKVFYYVATTLSFSEAVYLPVCSQPVHQDTGKETESDAVYSQYKKSPSHSGRGDPPAPH